MSTGAPSGTRSRTDRRNAYIPALARSLRGAAGFSSNDTTTPSSTSRMPHASGLGAWNTAMAASAAGPLQGGQQPAQVEVGEVVAVDGEEHLVRPDELAAGDEVPALPRRTGS